MRLVEGKKGLVEKVEIEVSKREKGIKRKGKISSRLVKGKKCLVEVQIEVSEEVRDRQRN